MVNTIPEGFHTLTPYLVVDDAKAAINFYKKAFNASLTVQIEGPDGIPVHSELIIGDSIFMLCQEYPEMGFLSPKTLGGSAINLMLYVDNVDSIFPHIIAAGATEIRPVVDQFYGDRSGSLKDPFGHYWTIATHIEDLTSEELQKRSDEFMKTLG